MSNQRADLAFCAFLFGPYHAFPFPFLFLSCAADVAPHRICQVDRAPLPLTSRRGPPPEHDPTAALPGILARHRYLAAQHSFARSCAFMPVHACALPLLATSAALVHIGRGAFGKSYRLALVFGSRTVLYSQLGRCIHLCACFSPEYTKVAYFCHRPSFAT